MDEESIGAGARRERRADRSSAHERTSCPASAVGAVALQRDAAAREAHCRRTRIVRHLLWAWSPDGNDGSRRA